MGAILSAGKWKMIKGMRDIEYVIRSLKTVLANGHRIVPVPDSDLRLLLAEIERLQEYKRRQMEDIMTLGQQVGNLEVKNEQLRATGDAAFLAMCAYRDGGDLECFQDAIDELGVALEQKVSDPDEGLPTAADVRGILKPPWAGKNER